MRESWLSANYTLSSLFAFEHVLTFLICSFCMAMALFRDRVAGLGGRYHIAFVGVPARAGRMTDWLASRTKTTGTWLHLI